MQSAFSVQLSVAPATIATSMIAHLRGKLLAKHPNQAIVEAGGVGYDVTISVPTFSDLPAVGAKLRCTSTPTFAKTSLRSTDFCARRKSSSSRS